MTTYLSTCNFKIPEHAVADLLSGARPFRDIVLGDAPGTTIEAGARPKAGVLEIDLETQGFHADTASVFVAQHVEQLLSQVWPLQVSSSALVKQTIEVAFAAPIRSVRVPHKSDQSLTFAVRPGDWFELWSYNADPAAHAGATALTLHVDNQRFQTLTLPADPGGTHQIGPYILAIETSPPPRPGAPARRRPRARGVWI